MKLSFFKLAFVAQMVRGFVKTLPSQLAIDHVTLVEITVDELDLALPVRLIVFEGASENIATFSSQLAISFP